MANTTGKKFGGRKKGTPNKDIKILRERINNLLDNHFGELEEDFKSLTPKERIDAYIKLLEYAVPKLSRTEISNKPFKQIVGITFKDAPEADID